MASSVGTAKSDICIRNSFSSKYHLSAHQGKTLDRFLKKYICRPAATEPLLLGAINNDQIVKNAISSYQSPRLVHQVLQQKRGADGRGFDDRNLSCTNKQINHDAMLVQKLYKRGHSIDKMVISFRTSYLRKKHVVDSGFQMSHTGAGFGHTDQGKLRIAIRRSMNQALAYGRFTNPVYAGALQFDRNHVHCHLVVADDCPLSQSKRLVPFKKQNADEPWRHEWHREDRGEFSQDTLGRMRHGLDFNLDMMKPYEPIHSAPFQKEHNLLENVQLVANRERESSVYLQELIASLPSNTHEWYAQNRNPAMKRPRQLMDDYLDSMVRNNGKHIGYYSVLDSIRDTSIRYSSKTRPADRLYQNGVHNLHNAMANSLYSQMSRITQQQMQMSTPSIKDNAMDVTELAQLIQQAYSGKKPLKNPSQIMFNYRLNSYKLRYVNSLRKREFYRKQLAHFDHLSLENKTQPLARELLRGHYVSEKNHYTRLSDKYRSILGSAPHSDEVTKRLQSRKKDLMKRYHAFQNIPHAFVNSKESHFPKLTALLGDPALSNVLTLRLSKNSPYTYYHELSRYRINLNVKPSKMIMRRLGDIEKAFPKYRGATDEIAKSRYNQPKLIMNLDAKNSYNHYVYDLVNYDDACYDAGLYNSSDIHDYEQTRNHEIAKPHAMRKHNQLISPKHYEHVKGDDLDDCIFDLAPHHNRKVSQHTEDDFDEDSSNRYQHAMLAREYIQQTRQLAFMHSIDQLIRHLHYQRKLSERIKKTHQMPITKPKSEQPGHQRQRNLVTLDLTQASHYTRHYLQNLSRVDDDFTNDLEHNPQKILSPDYDEHTPNTSITGISPQ